MRILNWNIGWSTANRRKKPLLEKIIAFHDPDIVVLTEAHRYFEIPGLTLVAEAGAYYGYGFQLEKRKVLLYSRFPSIATDPWGAVSNPGGRFASVMVDSPVHPVGIIGVCIPWSHAHVSTGRKDRRLWQDHLNYLVELKSILTDAASSNSSQIILCGDFNQRIPRRRQPEQVFQSLCECMKDWHLHTGGVEIDAIDHMLTSLPVSEARLSIIPNHQDGLELSDHPGYVLEV